MRRSFRFVGLFMFIFQSHFIIAQISVGIKTGLHLGDARVEGLADNFLPDPTVYAGGIVGGIVEIPMLNGFSFRPEIQYVQKGFQAMEQIGITEIDIPVGAGLKTRLNYVEMPLLIKYSTGSEKAKFYAVAGPGFSYAAQAWVRPVVRTIIDFTLPRQDLDLSANMYRRWEASAIGGIGGEFKAGNGKIFTDVRYTYGLSNLFDNPIIDVRLKNQGLSLSAGYTYHF